MDESTADDRSAPCATGFAGQRMLVVPAACGAGGAEPARSQASSSSPTPGCSRTRPGTGDRGPTARSEHVLLVCTDGAGVVPDRPDGTGRACRAWRRRAAARGRTARVRRRRRRPVDAVVVPRPRGRRRRPRRRGSRRAGGPVTHLRDAAPVASLVSQVIDALDAGTPRPAFVRPRAPPGTRSPTSSRPGDAHPARAQPRRAGARASADDAPAADLGRRRSPRWSG